MVKSVMCLNSSLSDSHLLGCYVVLLSESSSLARQPLMGPGLLKKLCPFAFVEGDPVQV